MSTPAPNSKPGSKARDKQIKKLVTSQSGAKAIEKELKRLKPPKPKPKHQKNK